MTKLFVGDVGTEIVIDCGADISSASVTKILVIKPNGQKAEWSATLNDSTSIKHTVTEGELSMAGDWNLQAYVELPTWKGHGDFVVLPVASRR